VNFFIKEYFYFPLPLALTLFSEKAYSFNIYHLMISKMELKRFLNANTPMTSIELLKLNKLNNHETLIAIQKNQTNSFFQDLGLENNHQIALKKIINYYSSTLSKQIEKNYLKNSHSQLMFKAEFDSFFYSLLYQKNFASLTAHVKKLITALPLNNRSPHYLFQQLVIDLMESDQFFSQYFSLLCVLTINQYQGDDEKIFQILSAGLFHLIGYCQFPMTSTQDNHLQAVFSSTSIWLEKMGIYNDEKMIKFLKDIPLAPFQAKSDKTFFNEDQLLISFVSSLVLFAQTHNLNLKDALNQLSQKNTNTIQPLLTLWMNRLLLIDQRNLSKVA
jgi:hypothetical protein